MQTLDASSAEEKADYGVIKEKIRADLKRYFPSNAEASADHAGNLGNIGKSCHPERSYCVAERSLSCAQDDIWR